MLSVFLLNNISVFMLKIIFFCVWIFITNLTAYEFAIATMFKNEAPYLREWIEYHRMVGAEHFWLYNNGSTDNWKEVLDPYIDEGLVEMIFWPPEELEESKSGTFPFKVQVEAMKDSLRKAKGKAKWFSFIDIDEFFFPKNKATVPECLNTYFSEASAVFVNWRSFGTNNMYIPKGEPFLCHLTSCTQKKHHKNMNGKTICRPDLVDIDSVWWVHGTPLNLGEKYVNGKGKKMIADAEKAGWHWDVYDKYICLNHYFFRDEDFFLTRRLPFAEKGWSEYSVAGLLQFYQDALVYKDLSMKEFIQVKHPDMYEKYWKKYE